MDAALKGVFGKTGGQFQKNNVIKGFCGIRPLKNKLMVIIVKLLGEIKRKDGHTLKVQSTYGIIQVLNDHSFFFFWHVKSFLEKNFILIKNNC